MEEKVGKRWQYDSIEDYEMDTNRSTIPITREQFKEEMIDENDGLSIIERNRLTWKYLFICRPNEYSRGSILKELNKLHNKGYEIVFILGDCSKFLMKEISGLFESALILQLPEEYFWKYDAKDFCITNFIGKRQKTVGGKYIVGVGSGTNKDIARGDILVTTRDAINDPKIMQYVMIYHPKLVFYLTNERSNRKRAGATTFIGCRGILPYTFNAHKVLGVNPEDLEN